MVEVVAREQGLCVSPRKQPDRDIERFLGGGPSDDGDIEEENERDDEERMMMEYERNHGGDDDLIISPIIELPLPNGQRDDEHVYKCVFLFHSFNPQNTDIPSQRSSLNFQRNEDNIDVQDWKPVHSDYYNRS
jgi:hypothetical protein